jgi:hypothetical protein
MSSQGHVIGADGVEGSTELVTRERALSPRQARAFSPRACARTEFPDSQNNVQRKLSLASANGFTSVQSMKAGSAGNITTDLIRVAPLSRLAMQG